MTALSQELSFGCILQLTIPSDRIIYLFCIRVLARILKTIYYNIKNFP